MPYTINPITGELDVITTPLDFGNSWLGVWAALTAYASGDVVSHAGQFYACKQASTGDQPDLSPTFWDGPLARGIQGPAGADGAQGPAGADGAQGPAGGQQGPAGADGVGVPVGGTTGQALTKASDADHDTTWSTVSGSGSGGMLGFAAYSGWADGETKTLTLSTPAGGIGKCQVAVFEEVPDQNIANSDWDLVANETGWSSRNHAPAASLTPAAVSGDRVALTLGSGAWATADVGRRVVNLSAGESGSAVILWVVGAVATAKITNTFTDTNAIASGDWALYGSEFSNTSPGEVMVSGVNRGGGLDEYVTLLVSSEAANNSTAFADTSRSGKAVTAVGSAVHSTSQAKFGASSISLPGGTGEHYLSVADDIGNQLSRTGPWVIDFWFHPLTSQLHTIFNKKFYTAGVNGGWTARVYNSGSNGTHVISVSYSNGTTYTGAQSNNNLTIAVGTWYHIEIANTGDGALVFYLNGIQVGTNTIDASYALDVSGYPLIVGSNTAGVPLTSPPNGHLEEVRISKGIVRHTSNFTPPAAPYSEAAQHMDSWVVVLSDADQIDTASYLDWNSTGVTQTLNGQETAFAFSTDGRASFVVMNNAQSPAVRTIVSSKAADHGGSEGTWYVNTHATYTSATWGAATVNEIHAALEQAMATTTNRMDKVQLEAVADANHPAFGATLDCAILMKTTSLAATPTVDAVSFNYDGNVRHLLKTGSYEVEMAAVNQVKVKAPASGGPRNARVYVSA